MAASTSRSRSPGRAPLRLAGEPSRDDLADLAEANPLPADFVFGVSCAAFQNEGGFNGPGEPKNNFFDWERSGKVERSGVALDFWADPDSHLDRAAAIGCNGFRMSVEWARVLPSTAEAEAPAPAPDEGAIDRYAEIMLGCRRRGMEPLVTLHHFTHPRWLGLGAWTRDATVDHFIDYVGLVVEGLNKRLVDAGSEPLKRIITLNEINGPGPTSYMVGMFPPGRVLDFGDAMRVTDRLLAAHIHAYDTIHDLYETNSWAAPEVTTNNFVTWTWGTERILTDLLLARECEVAYDELPGYLADCRSQFRSIRGEDPNPPVPWRRRLDQFLDWATDRIGPRHLPVALGALYGSARPVKLDSIAFDYYDPYLSNGLKRPGRDAGAGQTWNPIANFWEQVVNPPGLALFCQAATLNATGKPVVIAENGMAGQVASGLAYDRPDGIARDEYLRRHLAQVLVALGAGIPLAGYYHWTLIDNYEWGSYEPRFGLHEAIRSGDKVEISDLDAMEVDAAGAYREVIEALTSGDAARIADVLSR